MCVEGEIKVKFCVEEKKGECVGVRINDDIQTKNSYRISTNPIMKRYLMTCEEVRELIIIKYHEKKYRRIKYKCLTQW